MSLPKKKKKSYDPFQEHWSKSKIFKSEDIDKSYEYYMKNQELKYEYFEPDFVSEDGIEIQIPYGKDTENWYDDSKSVIMDRDLYQTKQKRKIKWDDQRMFLRMKKKVRTDFAQRNYSLEGKDLIFKSTKGNAYMIATVNSVQRNPRRATGFIYLTNVKTLSNY